jgi:hypothetical protein
MSMKELSVVSLVVNPLVVPTEFVVRLWLRDLRCGGLAKLPNPKCYLNAAETAAKSLDK